MSLLQSSRWRKPHESARTTGVNAYRRARSDRGLSGWPQPPPRQGHVVGLRVSPTSRSGSESATESRELDAGSRVVGRLRVTCSASPLPPDGGGRRCTFERLPLPPVEGGGAAHSGVAPLRQPPVSTEIECVWRFGVRRRRGPCRSQSLSWSWCRSQPSMETGRGEPVRGGSTRPVAEQCGTTVRHCVIPRSESISAQRGADVRVVEDPQGGRQATRSTDRGWSLSRSAGSAGSAGSRWRLRRAPGNSPGALDHVAATSSGISGRGCGCACPAQLVTDSAPATLPQTAGEAP